MTTVSRDEVIAREERYDSGVYSKQPIVLVRGLGAHVWDMDGTEYIDCVGGHGAANLGHAHPAVVAAVTEQAQRLFLAPNGFYNDIRAQLLAEGYNPIVFCRFIPKRSLWSNEPLEEPYPRFACRSFSAERHPFAAKQPGGPV